MRKLISLFLVIYLGSCSAIPDDPAGTSQRVIESGTIRIGVMDRSDTHAVAGFVNRLEMETGSRSRYYFGPGEGLLQDVEEGRLDMVIGEFSQSSPWNKNVYLSAPIGKRVIPDDMPIARAAVRNGENRWIMLVEKLVAE